MTDLTLIQEIKENNKKSFEILFQRYYHSLVAYITTFTKDPDLSEDIVQQTFIKIWTRRAELNIKTTIKSYLYTATYNCFVDHYRKTKSLDLFFEEFQEQALRNAIDEDKELTEKKILKLKEILETLPPKCREILELNKIGGLKYREIAEQLDISQKTVEAQIRIAFQKIRQGFENDPKLLALLINFAIYYINK